MVLYVPASDSEDAVLFIKAVETAYELITCLWNKLHIFLDAVLRERQVPARPSLPAEREVLRVDFRALSARGPQYLELLRECTYCIVISINTKYL
jgi:hypothetical protein